MMKTIALALPLVAVPCSPAETISVCLDGSCDFTDVQAAIDHAGDGDLILVAAGTYQPNSTIETDGKMVTIRGEIDDEGRPATILDGRWQRRVLRCDDNETAETRFENLAFIRGDRTAGAGVRINHSQPTLVNCEIRDNISGGGMYLYNARPMLVDCVISDNQCDWSGGGLQIYDNSNPWLVDTIVCGNQAKYDPQLSLDQGSIWTDAGDNCISDDCNDCSETPSPDLNRDGLVDGAALGLLLVSWGGPGIGDLNGDGMTDGGDLGILLAAWS